MSTLLRAARLQPAAFTPIQFDAGVLIDGNCITAVESFQQLHRDHPEATVTDLGDVLLLPGLINAHVHLELSNHPRGPAPASFVDWLLELMGRSLDPAAGAAIGVEQCLRFGVTAVGDISRQCTITRALLANSPLRIVSFGEVQAMAQRRTLLDERFAAATDTSAESDTLTIGISPHAPYSIEPDGYRTCLAFAQKTGRPLATHLAETPDEREFLANHTGMFARLWKTLNAWDESVPTFQGGPIRFAQSLGLLDYPTLLAHVNECDDDELDILAAGRASVVYCPRTHAYFDRPPHRWREMIARGINVAIGTDSCASSGDLNLMDDLRLLRDLADADTLLAMATINASKAIGLTGAPHVHAGLRASGGYHESLDVGKIMPGVRADVVAWRAKNFGEILATKSEPIQVWTGGKRRLSRKRLIWPD
ncbi:MAG: amidohydrolase family protein [Phycisphaerae bacterium]|nr:amidohydrolase family protein [Phycisphaerae bacterium]